MRLGEALEILRRPAKGPRKSFHLLAGITPLHLETLLKARLRLRFPVNEIALDTGLFDDLEGNVQRAGEAGGEGAAAIVEWRDLDQRLGFRASAGWTEANLDDIPVQVEARCRRLEAGLAALGREQPVAVVPPGLPLPPLTYLPPARAGAFELRLRAIVAEFLCRIADCPGIRIVSEAVLGAASPPGGRHDVKVDLQTGFPFTLTHADALAELAIQCLFPPEPKKGLITDLDQTLWKGILGDAGPEGVSWSLEDKSQVHALYQQTLASLADSGVLVAIASKNDATLVEAALGRSDILLKPEQIFPIEANWGVKSDAVGRIVEAWNIGADSVVFVDDSPMELAEVAEKYPGIETMRFDSGDPAGVIALLKVLRERFGRAEVRAEDRLRLGSLRASATLREESGAKPSGDFLARLAAIVTFREAGDDPRALELVNKTNQFNLNGRRFTEAEWKSRSAERGFLLATVSYEDRFGPLGKIAVVGGRPDGGRCLIDVWVMSCRAFSRQIEYQTLRALFEKTGAESIAFDFIPTPRNGPLQTFLSNIFGKAPEAGKEIELSAADFTRACPELFHEVNDQWTLSEKN